jgi:hypothetical protein
VRMMRTGAEREATLPVMAPWHQHAAGVGDGSAVLPTFPLTR